MHLPIALHHRGPPYWLLVALGATLFLIYEWAEFVWLGEEPSATLRRVREIRAVLACLLLTAVTVHAGGRRRLTPFPSMGANTAPMEANPLIHLADWFLWVRWLACTVAASLVLVTVEVVHLLPTTLLYPLLGSVALLALCNYFFARALSRHPTSVSCQVSLQVAVDLVTFTTLLHFSGGIENPLSLLYMLHVIIAGILFSRRRCYAVAWAAFACFALLVGLEFLGVLPHYTLELFPHASHGQASGEDMHAAHFGPYVFSRVLLQGLILLITGYFITTIMEQLRGREQDVRDFAVSEGEARQRLESVVDAAGIGLRLLDHELTPSWTNARYQLWAPEGQAPLAAASRTLQDGLPRTEEYQVKQADGTIRFFALTTAAMAKESGDPHDIVQLTQDITARKRAEAEAIHIGKLAAIGELAGNLAHEINNPLGILSARLHLLIKARKSSDEHTDSVLRKLIGLVDRITGITRSLLGHVRPSESERSSLSIGPVLDRAAVLMETWASRKEVRINWQADDDSPTILGSAGELEQVLVNLLANAVDASPPGGTVTLTASGITRDSRPTLRISVEDEGPGVPDALLPRIFEPFFSTKKTGEGTGLGLSLSCRIVQDHGGEIRVERGRVGARFLIEIPPQQDLEA